MSESTIRISSTYKYSMTLITLPNRTTVVGKNTLHKLQNLQEAHYASALVVDHSRVRTDIKTLYSRTFQDLQRPNSRVILDSKNSFSKTFQDTLRSQTWLHEVRKCTYQISFRCNCITVNKPKCNTGGCINVFQQTQNSPASLVTGPRLINNLHQIQYFSTLVSDT